MKSNDDAMPTRKNRAHWREAMWSRRGSDSFPLIMHQACYSDTRCGVVGEENQRGSVIN